MVQEKRRHCLSCSNSNLLTDASVPCCWHTVLLRQAQTSIVAVPACRHTLAESATPTKQAGSHPRVQLCSSRGARSAKTRRVSSPSSALGTCSSPGKLAFGPVEYQGTSRPQDAPFSPLQVRLNSLRLRAWRVCRRGCPTSRGSDRQILARLL